MKTRQIVLEPEGEASVKKPFTIWIGQRAKAQYKDIRERFKRAPIVDDLTLLIEDRINEWHEKVVETEGD